MSWLRESAALARQLAVLVVEGSSARLVPEHLEEALAARRDLVLLLRRVLGEVRATPSLDGGGAVAPADQELPIWLTRSVTAERITAGHVVVDPVAALARGLGQLPVPRGWHPRADDAGEVPASSDWVMLRRQTHLAAQAWGGVRIAELSGEQRWSTVADAAAMTEAVCVLDGDLAGAARRAGPGRLWELEEAVESDLRLAAREAAEVAAAGPLPAWDHSGGRQQHLPVVVVGTAEGLPAAQDRLVALLDDAASMSPQAVALVATGQARFLAAAGAALSASPEFVEQGRWAVELSDRIAGSVVGAQRLASTRRGGARAVTQSRELAGYVRRSHRDGRAFPPRDLDALTAAVSRAPRVLGALARQADRGWRGGAWMVPDPRGDVLRWVPAKKTDREPRLCERLSGVAAWSVARPGPAVAGGASSSAGPTPPREILAGIGRVRRRARPALPSERPRVEPGRG